MLAKKECHYLICYEIELNKDVLTERRSLIVVYRIKARSGVP